MVLYCTKGLCVPLSSVFILYYWEKEVRKMLKYHVNMIIIVDPQETRRLFSYNAVSPSHWTRPCIYMRLAIIRDNTVWYLHPLFSDIRISTCFSCFAKWDTSSSGPWFLIINRLPATNGSLTTLFSSWEPVYCPWICLHLIAQPYKIHVVYQLHS